MDREIKPRIVNPGLFMTLPGPLAPLIGLLVLVAALVGYLVQHVIPALGRSVFYTLPVMTAAGTGVIAYITLYELSRRDPHLWTAMRSALDSLHHRRLSDSDDAHGSIEFGP